MKRIKFYDDDQLVIVGARFGSPDVAREADRVAGLLEKYGAALLPYGIDEQLIAQFEDLRKRHQKFIAERTQGVAAKQNTIARYNGVLHAAWTWLEQAHAVLTPFARRDRDFATRLNMAIPEAENELASAIIQMRQLLEEKKSALSAHIQVDAMLSASQDIEKQVSEVVGGKLQAKTNTREDTRELDRLDGELYLWMSDIYEAGRKAVRANRIEAPREEFTFHYCYRKNTPAAPAAPDA